MATVRGRAPFTHALFHLTRETDHYWIFTLKPCPMSELDPRQEIRVRKSDRMIHGQGLTAAASNGKKRFESWFRLDKSKDFIAALGRSPDFQDGGIDQSGIALTIEGYDQAPSDNVSNVVKTVRSGPVCERGMWIHARLIDKVVEWAKQPLTQKIEAPIQERVARAMPDSEREVRCPTGVIDIISHCPPVIVEVKDVKDWMKGIGQLFGYGHYFPSYKKRLLIFRTDRTSPGQIQNIKEVCEGCGIELTMYEDLYGAV
eukprot:jgi/Mesvir1/13665/Mv25966-RA.1